MLAMMKEEAPEMASRLEAQLLVKHLQEDIGARTSFNFKEPNSFPPARLLSTPPTQLSSQTGAPYHHDPPLLCQQQHL